MASISFPPSPDDGDPYVDSVSGITWIYRASIPAWVPESSSGGTGASFYPNTVFVDSLTGNNSTAELYNPSKPFATWDAAYTAVNDADPGLHSSTSYVFGPGSYSWSSSEHPGLMEVNFVSLQGAGNTETSLTIHSTGVDGSPATPCILKTHDITNTSGNTLVDLELDANGTTYTARSITPRDMALTYGTSAGAWVEGLRNMLSATYPTATVVGTTITELGPIAVTQWSPPEMEGIYLEILQPYAEATNATGPVPVRVANTSNCNLSIYNQGANGGDDPYTYTAGLGSDGNYVDLRNCDNVLEVNQAAGFNGASRSGAGGHGSAVRGNLYAVMCGIDSGTVGVLDAFTCYLGTDVVRNTYHNHGGNSSP